MSFSRVSAGCLLLTFAINDFVNNHNITLHRFGLDHFLPVVDLSFPSYCYLCHLFALFIICNWIILITHFLK